MNITGLQKLTLLDYPGHTACTVFTSGCNFCCPFCHNSALVTRAKEQPCIPFKEIYEFLSKRSGLLQGICISGGEPCIQEEFIDFIYAVKKLGYYIKLDTNGSKPEIIKELIEKQLINYLAMDIKNSLNKYPFTVGIPAYETASVEESVQILMSSELSYEFRTTVVEEFHTLEDMKSIGRWIQGAQKYFLQQFEDSGDTIVPNLHPVSYDILQQYREILTPYIQEVYIRG